MIEIDFKTKPSEDGEVPEYVIDRLGNKSTYDEKGLRHSYNGHPGWISSDGKSKVWYSHGEETDAVWGC